MGCTSQSHALRTAIKQSREVRTASPPYKTSSNIGAGDPRAKSPAYSARSRNEPGNAAEPRKHENGRRMYIYVLDRNGKPLMPTTRYGKVRRMLRDGRAVVESHTPFTIRLTYDTTSFVQPVHLGLDAGSVHVGVSACTDERELYAAEVGLRTDIVSNIATRREARRTRRGKRTVRYRAPRFDNRRRPEGWLAPSLEQKVEQNVRAATRVMEFLPVSTVTVEVAQFDMQLIKNPGIEGTGYQHGPQEGFWNAREYVLWRDGHECRCCHGK